MNDSQSKLPTKVFCHIPTNEAADFAAELASYSNRTLISSTNSVPEDSGATEIEGGNLEEKDGKDPENDYVSYRVNDLNIESRKLVEDFEKLLDTVMFVDVKVVSLWRQIYKNAVQDRMNSLLAWSDLYFQVHQKPDMHALHGDRLAKYAQGCEKANAQLIKLSEMIALTKIKNEDDDDGFDQDKNIYDRIQKSKNQKKKD
jgi:hypothetical protein